MTIEASKSVAESRQAGQPGSSSASLRRNTPRRQRLVRALIATLAASSLAGSYWTLSLAVEPEVARPQLRPGVRLQARLREKPPAAPPTMPADPPAQTTAVVRNAVTPEPATANESAGQPHSDQPALSEPNLLEPGEVPELPGRSLDELNATDDPQLEPVDSAATPPGSVPGDLANDVHPAEFQGLVPCETTADAVREKLGPPRSELAGTAGAIWVYQIGPFPRVEIRLHEQRVQTIRVQLSPPMHRKQVFADLQLDDFEVVSLWDEHGQSRGEAIPERGLQVTWSSHDGQPYVSQILLAVPTSEGFVRRVMQEERHRYQRMLNDLSLARKLDPQHPRPLALEALIRGRLGQPKAALELATTAVHLEPRSPDYRLLQAQLLSIVGRQAEALRLAEQVAADKTIDATWRARAAVTLGELVLRSPQGRPDKALEQFRSAINQGGALANDSRPEVLESLPQLLVDAYLGGATAIAQSQWPNRAAAVQDWWTQAAELTHQSSTSTTLDSLARWELLCQQLSIISYAGGLLPTQAIDDLHLVHRRLVDRAGDALLTARLDWELGEALLHAAEISQAGGLWPEAHEFALEGLQRAEAGAAVREPGGDTQFLVGRLEFLVGAFHAVVSKDETEIKFWFDKAVEHLHRPVDELPSIEHARQGERLVFMGQQYDRLGQRDAALRCLARGVDVLEPLAARGGVAKSRAAAALRELAAVHRAAGHDDVVQDLTARADKLTRSR